MPLDFNGLSLNDSNLINGLHDRLTKIEEILAHHGIALPEPPAPEPTPEEQHAQLLLAQLPEDVRNALKAALGG